MHLTGRNILKILILLIAAVVLPLFFKESRYYMNILNLAGIYVILTYSLNFVQGFLGLVSIGHAGFFAIGAYITAGLTRGMGLNFFPALFLGGISSALAGLLLGFPTLRIRGHYFVLVTLGFGEIVRQILVNWKEVTNGTNGVYNIPAPSLGGLTFDTRLSYFYLLLVFVFLVMLATVSVRRSKYGRSLLALKADELAATVMGVNSKSTKLIDFGLSAFFAGLAGGLYGGYMRSISPEVFTVELSVDLLTMVLVGGSGTVAGPVIGATFLVFLKEWLRFIKEYYMLVYGIGLVVVMIFMPYGFVGLAKRISARFRS